jgi:hypothetical protein
VTKGDRLRMEIAALRATAKRRRAIADRIVEAIDRLQRQIDAIFVGGSVPDDTSASRARKGR